MAGYDVIDHGPRRRRWVALAVLSGLVVVPLAGIILSRGRGLPPTPPSASASPSSALAARPTLSPAQENKLFPKETGGAVKSVKVTFPDGFAATVTYPSDVGLARLGVRPYMLATIGTRLRVFYAPAGGEAEVATGGPRIRDLTPNVSLWPGLPRAVGTLQDPLLLFAFKHWRIAMPDGELQMNFEERLAVARALHGKVTSDGYLVLTADPPIQLGSPGAVMGGLMLSPQLWFGGAGDPIVVLVHTVDCRKDMPLPDVVVQQPEDFAGGCASKDVYIAVGGPSDLVHHVLDTVRVQS
ncbi:hypothetical protein J5X84_10255 [Streptosporangiaceae bacterium NEAU-GS5]|nr:hypothetical protein [Streptosporangiaceae bacterium NEAU-GS5]